MNTKKQGIIRDHLEGWLPRCFSAFINIGNELGKIASLFLVPPWNKKWKSVEFESNSSSYQLHIFGKVFTESFQVHLF